MRERTDSPGFRSPRNFDNTRHGHTRCSDALSSSQLRSDQNNIHVGAPNRPSPADHECFVHYGKTDRGHASSSAIRFQLIRAGQTGVHVNQHRVSEPRLVERQTAARELGTGIELR